MDATPKAKPQPKTFAGRERFLRGFKRRYQEVTLPDGEIVRIQNLSEAEKSRVDTASIDYKKSKIVRKAAQLSRARLLVACIVDAAGARLFGDDDTETLATELDSRDSQVIYAAILEWVGGDDEDFEETVKNSVDDPAGGTP